jgi:hypothetical protein
MNMDGYGAGSRQREEHIQRAGSKREQGLICEEGRGLG